MPRRRPRLSDQLAVQDLADHIVRQIEQVFVGREAFSGAVHLATRGVTRTLRAT